MEPMILDFDLKIMIPELIIVSAAVLLLCMCLVWKESVSRKWWTGLLGLLAIWAALGFIVWNWGHPPSQILADSYRLDAYSSTFKLLILIGASLIFLFSWDKKERKAEYDYLLLTATLGGMMMVSSADLLTLFVGLELLSLSSYILVGIRRENPLSNETAWKYVILGGVSSAFILYGISFMYGLTGSTHLFAMQPRLAEALEGGYSTLFFLSFFLMLVGFGFKIATAPFHTWAPDVYQGTSTAIATFLAVVSKTAAFAFVGRVLLMIYIPLASVEQWNQVMSPALVIVAVLSMVIGNTVAIRQINVKRLLAYSSIAQAGYILVPLSVLGFGGALLFPSMLYYLFGYLWMTVGVFMIFHLVSQTNGSEEIGTFAGLHQRSPGLALIMTIFLISLAGIPVTAGFFGKFYLIMNAIGSQQLWLAGVMILATVISYYYYFSIVRQMYFQPASVSLRIQVPWPAKVVIGLCLIGTLALGFFPDPILHHLGKMDWGGVFTPIEGNGGR